MESWKDIKGYEGKYQISDLGSVKSIGRKMIGKSNSIRISKEIILKQGVGTQGYFHVCLTKKSEKKTFKIHKLVAEAFLSHLSCGYKEVVDHIDNNPKNNKISNLQLVSQRLNMTKDQFRKNPKSKYVGVSRSQKKWRAKIYFKGNQENLGLFLKEEEAHLAYQKRLNQITNV